MTLYRHSYRHLDVPACRVLHIGLNMFSLYFVGAVTEQIFGSGRFTIIYFAAGIVGGIVQA